MSNIYSWVQNRTGSFLKKINFSSPNIAESLNITNLYIDLSDLINYLLQFNLSSTDIGVFTQIIINSIQYISITCKPTNLIYLALDGVLPANKFSNLAQKLSNINQQFSNQMQSEDNDNSINNIRNNLNFLPGSENLSQFEQALKLFISQQVIKNPKVKYILDGGQVQGEGQSKITAFIKNQKLQNGYNHSQNQCIVSRNNQSFITILASNIENVYILFYEQINQNCLKCFKNDHNFTDCPELKAEIYKIQAKQLNLSQEILQNQDKKNTQANKQQIQLFQNGFTDTFYLVDFKEIKLFIEYEFKFINLPHHIQKNNLQNLIDDFCLLLILADKCDLLGYSIEEGGMDIFLYIYKRIFPFLEDYLTQEGQINFSNFQIFLKLIQEFEDTNIKYRSRSLKYQQNLQNLNQILESKLPTLKENLLKEFDLSNYQQQFIQQQQFLFKQKQLIEEEQQQKEQNKLKSSLLQKPEINSIHEENDQQQQQNNQQIVNLADQQTTEQIQENNNLIAINETQEEHEEGGDINMFTTTIPVVHIKQDIFQNINESIQQEDQQIQKEQNQQIIIHQEEEDEQTHQNQQNQQQQQKLQQPENHQLTENNKQQDQANDSSKQQQPEKSDQGKETPYDKIKQFNNLSTSQVEKKGKSQQQTKIQIEEESIDLDEIEQIKNTQLQTLENQAKPFNTLFLNNEEYLERFSEGIPINLLDIQQKNVDNNSEKEQFIQQNINAYTIYTLFDCETQNYKQEYYKKQIELRKDIFKNNSDIVLENFQQFIEYMKIDFIQNLIWQFRYYYDGQVSWSYQFLFNFPIFVSDIAFINNYDYQVFDLTIKSLSPIEFNLALCLQYPSLQNQISIPELFTSLLIDINLLEQFQLINTTCNLVDLEKICSVTSQYQEFLDPETLKLNSKGKTLLITQQICENSNKRNQITFQDTGIHGEIIFSEIIDSEVYIYGYINPYLSQDTIKQQQKELIKEIQPSELNIQQYSIEISELQDKLVCKNNCYLQLFERNLNQKRDLNDLFNKGMIQEIPQPPKKQNSQQKQHQQNIQLFPTPNFTPNLFQLQSQPPNNFQQHMPPKQIHHKQQFVTQPLNHQQNYQYPQQHRNQQMIHPLPHMLPPQHNYPPGYQQPPPYPGLKTNGYQHQQPPYHNQQQVIPQPPPYYNYPNNAQQYYNPNIPQFNQYR